MNENDLFNAFDKVFYMLPPPIYNSSEPHLSNISFHEVMWGWTHQPGYPTLRVWREEGDVDNVVTIEQLTSEEDPERAFWVPISYTYVGGDFEYTKQPRFWLHPKDVGEPIK